MFSMNHLEIPIQSHNSVSSSRFSWNKYFFLTDRSSIYERLYRMYRLELTANDSFICNRLHSKLMQRNIIRSTIEPKYVSNKLNWRRGRLFRWLRFFHRYICQSIHQILISDKEKKEIRKKISPSLASTSVIIQ